MKTNTYTKEFFRNNKLNIFLTLLVFIFTASLNLAISWYLQVLVDSITKKAAYSFMELFWLAFVFLMAIIIASASLAITYPRFLSRAMKQYKDEVFSKLLKKNISSFSKENTSTYISAFSNDALSIEDNYLKNIFQIIQFIVMFIGAIGLMFYYSTPMTFIVILLALVPMAISILTGNKLAEKELGVSQANESYVATVKDILSGFSIVKSFKAEKEVAAMYSNSNSKLEEAKKARNRTAKIIEGISSSAYLFTQLGTMLIGAWAILNGKGTITAGMLMGFINLVNFVVQPIASLPSLFAQRKAAKALIDKLAQGLEQNVEDRKTEIPQELKKGIGVENLSYSYDGEQTVLKDISTEFKIKKSYAIVGGSGSGKSTLLNLLMGSDENYNGNISFDGEEIRNISTSSLYETVSLIQQNVFIFNATIRDNITMFKDFKDEDVNRVIKLSGLDRVITDKGENYLCGENGNKLSGGERQRVAIARSLLKNSSVLLVDEATSALDNETANDVAQAILDLKDFIRIIVTHRLEESILSQYDSLIVLKDGKIVEEGNFRDLMDKKEYFYSLFVVSQ